MKTAKKIVLILLCITLLCALIYIVSNIVSSFVVLTSFPWWSAFVFAALYFGPALVMEIIALCILHLLQKKKQKSEQQS